MTIKEIEEASGMQRANIRFYEEEGLIHPEREKNGYRNYTEEDLKILNKIKLLRSLHVSLEDIKAMHRGSQDLASTLEEHIAYLTTKQQDLEKSKYVCEKMQRDGATYEKLNTEQYLLVLKKCLPNVTEKEEWVERDTPEPVQAPWLRIFARWFDYLLYATIWIVLVYIFHRIFIFERNPLVAAVIYSIVINILMAFLLEPLFLYMFGTTPGKALLGLWISYDVGGPIPMDMAWARSWRAILGHHDWKYHDIFQMINTYRAMADGEPLDWDYAANTTPELKDEKPWRKVAFTAATVCCILTIAYCCQSMRMVPNRGDVNTKEFVENYNTVRNVVYNGGMNIEENGEWAGKYVKSLDGIILSGGVMVSDTTVTAGGESRSFEAGGNPKKIDIVEENGVVTEVGFFYETRNRKEYLDAFKWLMCDLAFAFVEGEQNYNVFTYKKWAGVKEQIEQLIYGSNSLYDRIYRTDKFKDFSFTIGGVELTCDIELQGYELWQNYYVAKEGEDTYYSVRFTAKKIKGN